MKNVALLAEYGITGTLLTFNLFIFGTLLSLHLTGEPFTVGTALRLWSVWLQSFAQALAPLGTNDAISSASNAVLATFATLFIFCTGFLLEITAPLFFTPMEMLVFKRWMSSDDRCWFNEIVERNHELIKRDYESFVSSSSWHWLLPSQYLRHRQQYNRLRSFVFSYLFVHAGDVNIDEFTDQVRLWQTTRAIATSMIYLGVLLTWLAVDEHNTMADIAFVSIGLPSILFGISVLLTLAIFSRLCNTLCSLIFLIDRKVAPSKGGSTL